MDTNTNSSIDSVSPAIMQHSSYIRGLEFKKEIPKQDVHTSTNYDSALAKRIVNECNAIRASILPINDRVSGPLDRNADIFPALPLVFLLGNHSSGKSSFINYVLDRKIQDCGVAPTDDKFTILVAGSSDVSKDGNALVG